LVSEGWVGFAESSGRTGRVTQNLVCCLRFNKTTFLFFVCYMPAAAFIHHNMNNFCFEENPNLWGNGKTSSMISVTCKHDFAILVLKVQTIYKYCQHNCKVTTCYILHITEKNT
jgi:hypothetical protein